MAQSLISQPTPKGTTQLLARNLLGHAIGFRDCSASFLDELITKGRTSEYEKGDAIVSLKAPFRGLGLLVSGALEVDRVRRNGERHLIGLMFPGDLLGVAATFDGKGAVNDAYARSKVTMMFWGQNEVNALLNERREFSTALQIQLAFRYRLLNEWLYRDIGMPLPVRIASLLHMLLELYGPPPSGGAKGGMQITQVDLADWLGVARQSVNGAIKRLEALGLVALAYSSIRVTDPAKLHAYLDSAED